MFIAISATSPSTPPNPLNPLENHRILTYPALFCTYPRPFQAYPILDRAYPRLEIPKKAACLASSPSPPHSKTDYSRLEPTLHRELPYTSCYPRPVPTLYRSPQPQKSRPTPTHLLAVRVGSCLPCTARKKSLPQRQAHRHRAS